MNYREQCLGVVKYLNDKFGPVLWLPELGATPNKATMIQINKIRESFDENWVVHGKR